MTTQPKLVLASTSPYRAALLSQLGLDFDQVDPQINESAMAGEAPETLAKRLAGIKARAGALHYNGSHSCVVIGSDQIAHQATTIFHKPNEYDVAFQQLKQSAGRWVSFCTSICLVDESGSLIAEGTDTFDIKYRNLTDPEIQHYLSIEQPFDCAGSIKAEGRGIALIAETSGRDINTLYGLPLILLVDLLNSLGFETIRRFK